MRSAALVDYSRTEVVDLNFVLFFYDCDDTSEYDAFAPYAMGTPDVLGAGRYNQAVGAFAHLIPLSLSYTTTLRVFI